MIINKKTFNEYKKDTIFRFEKILHNSPKGGWDEQGLPAYTKPNPLMRFLFWERVKAAMGYVTENSRSNICLDFGCGLGVMIPFLRNYADSIIAFDIDNELLKIIGNQQKWDNVTYSTELDD